MTIPGDIICTFGRLSVSRRAFVHILYDYRNPTTIPTFPIFPSRSRFSTTSTGIEMYHTILLRHVAYPMFTILVHAERRDMLWMAQTLR